MAWFTNILNLIVLISTSQSVWCVLNLSSMDSMQTVTIIGPVRVSGSTCYRNSFTKEMVVGDQAVIYNATAENVKVKVMEGENIYRFCRDTRRSIAVSFPIR